MYRNIIDFLIFENFNIVDTIVDTLLKFEIVEKQKKERTYIESIRFNQNDLMDNSISNIENIIRLKKLQANKNLEYQVNLIRKQPNFIQDKNKDFLLSTNPEGCLELRYEYYTIENNVEIFNNYLLHKKPVIDYNKMSSEVSIEISPRDFVVFNLSNKNNIGKYIEKSKKINSIFEAFDYFNKLNCFSDISYRNLNTRRVTPLVF